MGIIGGKGGNVPVDCPAAVFLDYILVLTPEVQIHFCGGRHRFSCLCDGGYE